MGFQGISGLISGEGLILKVSSLTIDRGQRGVLAGVEGESHLVERLLDMGFHSGIEVEVVEKLPLGGPVVLRLGSSLLALRLEEAECLKIQR